MQSIIVDSGSDTIKIGFAGEDQPRVMAKNCIFEGPNGNYYGFDAIAERAKYNPALVPGLKSLFRPVDVRVCHGGDGKDLGALLRSHQEPKRVRRGSDREPDVKAK